MEKIIENLLELSDEEIEWLYERIDYKLEKYYSKEVSPSLYKIITSPYRKLSWKKRKDLLDLVTSFKKKLDVSNETRQQISNLEKENMKLKEELKQCKESLQMLQQSVKTYQQQSKYFEEKQQHLDELIQEKISQNLKKYEEKIKKLEQENKELKEQLGFYE